MMCDGTLSLDDAKKRYKTLHEAAMVACEKEGRPKYPKGEIHEVLATTCTASEVTCLIYREMDKFHDTVDFFENLQSFFSSLTQDELYFAASRPEQIAKQMMLYEITSLMGSDQEETFATLTYMYAMMLENPDPEALAGVAHDQMEEAKAVMSK